MEDPPGLCGRRAAVVGRLIDRARQLEQQPLRRLLSGWASAWRRWNGCRRAGAAQYADAIADFQKTQPQISDRIIRLVNEYMPFLVGEWGYEVMDCRNAK